MSGARTRVVAAAVLAAALALPALIGLILALVGDRVVGWDVAPEVVAERLALLLGTHGAVMVASHCAAAWAAWALFRSPPFSASTLAQPAALLGALRAAAGLLVVASAFVPALREPLVGVAVALIDAAFVAALLAVVAPALGGGHGRARAVGVAYAVVRVASAVIVVSSEGARAHVALAHRVLTVLVATAVALVLVQLARTLKRQAV